ncbi:hypothetical protein [Dermatophilus congolensis]|nr:hypothetical protein [Dermatophilus congolensis]MBO3146341.1 hypothetical protein [Dermatophilus congolensis]
MISLSLKWLRGQGVHVSADIFLDHIGKELVSLIPIIAAVFGALISTSISRGDRHEEWLRECRLDEYKKFTESWRSEIDALYELRERVAREYVSPEIDYDHFSRFYDRVQEVELIASAGVIAKAREACRCLSEIRDVDCEKTYKVLADSEKKLLEFKNFIRQEFKVEEKIQISLEDHLDCPRGELNKELELMRWYGRFMQRWRQSGWRSKALIFFAVFMLAFGGWLRLEGKNEINTLISMFIAVPFAIAGLGLFWGGVNESTQRLEREFFAIVLTILLFFLFLLFSWSDEEIQNAMLKLAFGVAISQAWVSSLKVLLEARHVRKTNKDFSS